MRSMGLQERIYQLRGVFEIYNGRSPDSLVLSELNYIRLKREVQAGARIGYCIEELAVYEGMDIIVLKGSDYGEAGSLANEDIVRMGFKPKASIRAVPMTRSGLEKVTRPPEFETRYMGIPYTGGDE